MHSMHSITNYTNCYLKLPRLAGMAIYGSVGPNISSIHTVSAVPLHNLEETDQVEPPCQSLQVKACPVQQSLL